MKKNTFLFSLLLAFGFHLNAQHRADRQDLTDSDAFTMILLENPQGYVKYDINQPFLELCTAWIADNIDNLNIKAVLCTGDLIEQSKNIIRNRNMLNLTRKEMWETLLCPSANIHFVVCGHAARGNGEFANNTGYRTGKNKSGKNVHQMMFNVRTPGGGWDGNGGDGWLRILEFMPDGKTIKISTYSLLFCILPPTKHLAHRKTPYDQFEIVSE